MYKLFWVVCVISKNEKVGTYSIGDQPAWRHDYDVSIISPDKRVVIDSKTLHGGNPPKKILLGHQGIGAPPAMEEVISWIKR